MEDVLVVDAAVALPCAAAQGDACARGAQTSATNSASVRPSSSALHRPAHPTPGLGGFAGRRRGRRACPIGGGTICSGACRSPTSEPGSASPRLGSHTFRFPAPGVPFYLKRKVAELRPTAAGRPAGEPPGRAGRRLRSIHASQLDSEIRIAAVARPRRPHRGELAARRRSQDRAIRESGSHRPLLRGPELLIDRRTRISTLHADKTSEQGISRPLLRRRRAAHSDSGIGRIHQLRPVVLGLRGASSSAIGRVGEAITAS